MARIKTLCPFCGPHPLTAREEYELFNEEVRFKFVESICQRCWDAIIAAVQGPNTTITFADPRPINEAEQLDGAR